MDDEKLIECVKKYSMLYDLSHEKYMNTKFKERMWKEIGEILEQPYSLCKTRWQNIRDQFKKCQTKKIAKSGQAAEKIRRYKYEDILSFLLPHLTERETISNINFAPEISNENENSSENVEVNVENSHIETNQNTSSASNQNKCT
ncbi:uncharacterized protein LOC143341191 [Colletes latitarsis]|uniref:uncharacterized protein LOC143341191 n=1 Tax=Colletes latitarsis TaxID=2605962 RepID=UPI004036124B